MAEILLRLSRPNMLDVARKVRALMYTLVMGSFLMSKDMLRQQQLQTRSKKRSGRHMIHVFKPFMGQEEIDAIAEVIHSA